ncbi:MAG TPA: LysR family transcriptional regulator [Burkholderiaceae bacterium]|nr:LysR family transcriptional regulator [Burkholderiaceae bacterium]
MSIPRFSTKQLDAFIAVADVLSFAAASDRLALTSSAVSQLISELEITLGFRLFDRSTRKVALSAAGRAFLPSAESALQHLRLAESAAADIRNGVSGVVRVAAPMVLASHFLPKSIQAYRALRPEVVVRIRDSSVESLVDLVGRGDVDMAIGPDRVVEDDVARRPLFPSPWVLWCAPEHPLAAKRTITWTDLKNYSLVAASRDHERNVAQMRKGYGDDDAVVPMDIVDNISTALGIAAANLAVTVSPAYVSSLALSMGLVMRRILEPEVMREVSLYLPSRRSTSPSASGFAEFLLKWGKRGAGTRILGDKRMRHAS